MIAEKIGNKLFNPLYYEDLMKNLVYRILGYNLDFGVVRIEGDSVSPRDVVIFASHPIAANICLNAQDVLFISNKGEAAKLNLVTAEVTQRVKTFQGYHRHCKLLLLRGAQSLCSISNMSVSVVDLNSLTVTQTFNAGLRREDGILKLYDYEDIKAPFEAKAHEEEKAFQESKKAKPSGPWMERKWYWASKRACWPINSEHAFLLDLDARAAAFQDDGTLIVPYTKKEMRPNISPKTMKGLGIARINLQAETIYFEDICGFDSAVPSRLELKAISADGTALLLDRHCITRREPNSTKLKRLFAARLAKSESVFEYYLEIWRIANTTVFNRHVSMGTVPAITHPKKPRREIKHKYPSLYETELKEAAAAACRLEAAKSQFKTLYETMIWSEEKFKSDFHESLIRNKVEIVSDLKRQFDRNQHMHVAAHPFTFIVENFLDLALKENPAFIQEWQTRPLNETQLKTLNGIKYALRRLTKKSVAFEWQSIGKDLHILEKTGHLRVVSPEAVHSHSYVIESLPKGVGTTGTRFSRKDASGLFIESTLNNGSIKDGLLINLPLRTVAKDGKDYISTRRVYDAECYKQDHDIAEKLSRRVRRGYVSIRSKSPANLLTGLSKLTQEYAKYHDEIVLSERWDAGLFHKKSLILENEIAKNLIVAQDPAAVPILVDFVTTVMQVSVKDNVTISAYPRDQKTGHVHWRVWHNDSETQVGMPSVNALIALQKTVPDLALTFYRYRDFEHDEYTAHTGLPVDVLPHITLDKPGVLNLLAITAFQFLATGRVENNLFAQHGMDLVATALDRGQLSPKIAAHIFVEEVKGLDGNLSWGENLGPQGLVAQAVYGLAKSSPRKVAFGQAMLDLYPEARAILAKKLGE